MFPYPSDYGLHVGHPLGFIGTDVYARYQRMAGRNVLYTMGFDAFGLPAEQFAVQTGQHPAVTTAANVVNYRKQLRRLGMSHDPRRSVETTDPGYYRWTQWIFARIFDSWYDPDATSPDGGVGRARPIAELVAEYEAGTRPTPDGRAWSSLTPRRAGRQSSTRSASPTSPRRPSTGAPDSARSSPTRRSPPTGAATAATSPCSSARCASG